MQNSDNSIQKIADMVMGALSSRFLLNENVMIPSTGTSGKIIKCSKQTYQIQVQDSSIIEVPFEEIKRRFELEISDICYFLECITIMTPLGRIVIENVFEKISQPGFGTRKATACYSNKPQHRAGSKKHEKDRGNIFQEVEFKNQIENYEQKAVKEIKKRSEPIIDLKTLEPLSIAELPDEYVPSLIKIYSFFSKFSSFTDFKIESLVSLAKQIQDPEYNSETIMSIHKFMVETIEKDIHSYGNRFLNELSFIVGRLANFEAKETIRTPKKRVQITNENWKQQVNAFLNNMCIDLDSTNILRFCQFIEKNSISTRIDLLIFLLEILYYTESLKAFVHDAQNLIKSEKPAGFKKNEASSSTEDNNEDQTRVLENPLRVHIGRYRNHILFLIDDRIILKDKMDYYIVSNEDAKKILNDLDPHIKAEKNTISNLKSVLNSLKAENKD